MKIRLSGKKRGMKLFPQNKYSPEVRSQARYAWISKTIHVNENGKLVASKGLTYIKSIHGELV